MPLWPAQKHVNDARFALLQTYSARTRPNSGQVRGESEFASSINETSPKRTVKAAWQRGLCVRAA
jgi:hypothetical protein